MNVPYANRRRSYVVSFVDGTCGSYVMERWEAEDLRSYSGVSAVWATAGTGAGLNYDVRALDRTQVIDTGLLR